MMKTKKIFTAVLSILFAVCLSFAVLPFASAKADDAALPEVTMKHGASIRLSTTGTLRCVIRVGRLYRRKVRRIHCRREL